MLEIIYPNLLIAQEETLLLAKGEQKEIYFTPTEQFSIGNQEIISAKHLPKKNLLLLKGKKIGFTDLLIFNKGKSAKTVRKIHIYVLAKNNHLQFSHLMNTLQSLDLNYQIHGTLISAKGTLDTLEQYALFKKLEKKYSEQLVSQIQLTPRLRNSIIGQVYYFLWKEDVQNLECISIQHNIVCSFDSTTPPQSQTQKSLQEQFGVQFLPSTGPNEKRNFKVRLKLVQLEQLEGEELRLGLHQLYGSFHDLFQEGLPGLLLRNEILLRKGQIHLSTLADPETLLRPGVPAQLEMGAEIPVPSSLNSSSTSADPPLMQWKFAGLKLKLTLIPKGHHFELQYETEFSRPLEGHIVGSKESSTLMVELNRPYQLFEIGHRTEGHEKMSFPWLGNLPLLGALFQSQSSQSTYKKIYGILVVEEARPLGQQTFEKSQAQGTIHEGSSTI